MQNTKKCVKSRNFSIIEKADAYSQEILEKSADLIRDFFSTDPELLGNMCFAVVGSVGRKEALESSDLDITPIARDENVLLQYERQDKRLRGILQKNLGIKVSLGHDLTKATSIEALVRTETIGGDCDNSARLTRRVLLLTESAQAGGGLSIRIIREKIVDAYASQERTSGRHVLALCNDISRYYKTLCIEYKAKIDSQNKDWCTRNIKLRHSRKIWYFSNILSITMLAEKHPKGEDSFRTALIELFEQAPIHRLSNALHSRAPLSLGRLLEQYALFLEFMSCGTNRDALRRVEHAKRYAMDTTNPFPAMKFSSDLVQQEIAHIMEELGPEIRGRIIEWFLL